LTDLDILLEYTSSFLCDLLLQAFLIFLRWILAIAHAFWMGMFYVMCLQGYSLYPTMHEQKCYNSQSILLSSHLRSYYNVIHNQISWRRFITNTFVSFRSSVRRGEECFDFMQMLSQKFWMIWMNLNLEIVDERIHDTWWRRVFIITRACTITLSTIQ